MYFIPMVARVILDDARFLTRADNQINPIDSTH